MHNQGYDLFVGKFHASCTEAANKETNEKLKTVLGKRAGSQIRDSGYEMGESTIGHLRRITGSWLRSSLLHNISI